MHAFNIFKNELTRNAANFNIKCWYLIIKIFKTMNKWSKNVKN